MVTLRSACKPSRLKVQDAEKLTLSLTSLWATEVELRKNFIQANAKFVKDLIFSMDEQTNDLPGKKHEKRQSKTF